MSNRNDYREDLEYIKSIADRDEMQVPDSLSEENILAMLPDRSEDTRPELEKLYSDGTDREGIRPQKTSSRKRPFRKWIAAAACLLVALIGGRGIYGLVTAPPDTAVVDGQLYTFRSQAEIQNLVRSLDPGSVSFYGRDNMELAEESTTDTGGAEGSAPATGGDAILYSSDAKSASAGGADHSDTYLQVAEVDEADIVKTDGRYIYYVTDSREVVILSAEDGKTTLMSRIGSDGVENYIQDIFLKGDTLVTVGYIYDGDEEYTGVVTYDISDRSSPAVIDSFRQTGMVISSRMVGDYVYLVTSDYVNKDGRIVPRCTMDGEFRDLPYDSICCVPEPVQSSYIVLSAMDITSGQSGRSAKVRTTAIFGASSDIYCNDHNLYSAVSEWDKDRSTTFTRIVRASLDGLKVRFNATTRVRGYIDGQFSMDEKDGYFRIATTGQRAGIDVNNLFVLDSKLRETGSITGFARNESIRAVRYFGDKAYVITYEQIDPLFIIDLSDPANPRIDGEVKIDGFSTLLIPAGEGRLLGIGHATGDNGYGGEYASGLKLALFDISDPSNPVVMDSKEFENMESPVQYTHKALTVNSGDGWYAFPYCTYLYNEFEPEEAIDGFRTENGVLVFGADDSINVTDQHKLDSKYLSRSVYIGDYIYALDSEGNVSSFRLEK